MLQFDELKLSLCFNLMHKLISRHGGSRQRKLDSKSVAEYVISNPDFLDDLVKNHVSQDRIRAWIKEPIQDDIGIIEAIDYEGNMAISAQEEAEEEEEKIHKISSSSSKREEIGKENASSSNRDLGRKLSGELVSKKFSKKTLFSKEISTKDDSGGNEVQEKEDNGQDAKEESGSKTKKEKDIGHDSNTKKEDFHDKPKEDEPRKEKPMKKSRGDSSFQQQMAELSFRQRKALIITRGRLLYPEVYQQQELRALLERPDLGPSCRELESPLFPYTEIQYDDINKVFILMCKNLLGKYGFPMTELCYFLTALKANYHNVEYHNYSHALSHAQSMYWILKKTPGVFTELEMKALMIASIAHDVGHPGLNETYLKKVRCTLGIMYDDPILEQHHVQTCFLILQDIRCNIFFDLESDDYRQILDDIKLTVLATNLQKYKSQCEKMRHIIETGVDFRKRHVRNSLKSLMMMACDLCSSWKRWEEHKNIVWSIYKEYFNQGDKEASFGITTPDHMLRINAESIPKYQTSFLENVVMPILRLLIKVFPQLKEVLKYTQDNLECWKTYQ